MWDIQMTTISKSWIRMACFLAPSGVSSRLIASRILGKMEGEIMVRGNERQECRCQAHPSGAWLHMGAGSHEELR
jgi:hypothetical protein